MKIAEIFYSVQGEIQVGQPMIFVRFSGCNLIKDGKACKFCDSLYAENGTEMDIKDVVKIIESYDCKNICFTGGEPLMHYHDIREVMSILNSKSMYWFYLETNGTYYNNELNFEFEEINCSPKKQSINKTSLKLLAECYDINFKFVYESSKDKWWEKIIKEFDIPKVRVYIMAEGKTRDEQIKKMKEVVEYCKKKGYNFTPRMHTLVWDNKRGV
jgi:7-carboxy-7-deazaguanine synthase